MIPIPRRAGFTFVELLVVIMVAGIIATLLVPSIARGRRNRRIVECAGNLSTLWKAANEYKSHFGAFPGPTGGAFWRELSRTAPPLVDPPVIFRCPLRSGGAGPGHIDYRGPKEDLNIARYKSGDVIGADVEDNHGPDAGGTVLRKSGDIINVPRDNGIWGEARTNTAP